MLLETCSLKRLQCTEIAASGGPVSALLTKYGLCAEAWRGGLHKEAQVDQEAQARPDSALHAPPGAIPLSTADPSCTAHHLHQACPL